VDGWGELSPFGVAGELWVGGAGVARGYLGQPSTTASRFVPDGFGGGSGGRLYRTGDRVRWRMAGAGVPDGVLEYLGRLDDQVKVRGHRVELGEIESALRSLPGVREAVVVAREDRPGEPRLVGYVVGEAGGEEGWRRGLLARLPEVMVPSSLVRLERLPLTANGKVDRGRLPAPESGAVWEAPLPGVEEVLAAIWSEVLGGGRVGRNDNFFSLGGDSILSIQVAARARQRGLLTTVEEIFRAPVLARLAAAITARDGVVPEPEAPGNAPFSLLSEEDRERLPPGLDDAYPLSLLQQGMVFHGEGSSETPLYHSLTTFRLGIAIEPELLAACLQAAMRAHPVLRTSFDLASCSQPVQWVRSSVPVPLASEDLRRLPEERQAGHLAAWLEEEKQARFQIDRAPLFRVRLHHLSEGESQISLSFHHAILDGWSVASLLSELFETYLQARDGAARPPVLPPEAAFRTFIELENRSRQSAAEQAFWAAELEGFEMTRLPRRVQRHAGEKGGQTLALPLGATLSSRLREVAASAGVTLKSVLLAAHLKALSVACGQHDVVTGLVSNGRPEAAAGDAGLGLFLNTLPFRLRLEAGSSWIELSRQAEAKQGALLPHRRYPMAQLRLTLQAGELFETVFNFVHMHRYGELMASGRIPVLAADSHQSANFTLAADFSLGVSSPELHLRLHYDLAVLSGGQATALAGHYEAILHTIAAAPEALHRTYAAGRESRPRPEPVPQPAAVEREWIDVTEKVSRRARSMPDAVAVRAGGQELTFAELAERSERLAGSLRDAGVGCETIVGIRVSRGLDRIVAVLAVLRAGGAYLPIGAGDPAERIEAVLRDAETQIVVSQTGHAGALPAWVRVISMDNGAGAPVMAPAVPPARIVPEQAAYVIYTSGSTGLPKGVVVTHRGIANLAAQAELFGAAPGRRVLQFASLSFDGAALDILGTLAGGGTLLVEPREALLPGPGLAELLRRERVNAVTLPPSTLAQVPESSLPDLDLVLVVGEDCGEDLAERWAPGRRLVNGYGPTEATVCVSLGRHVPGAGKPPVGSPIAGVQVYVVDAAGEKVPMGVAGELWVGGDGVARGYLGRPDRTAERFVPDPFSGVRGGRLFRTGDRGRWREDGALELSGRFDDQVKIRGYRIEPGEVAAALRRLPDVTDAAVMAREDVPGDKRLVGYVVASAGGETEWRQALRRQLPGYMVPATILRLDRLPLTASGKLDRRALPAPESREPDAREWQAPRTPVEQVLAEIWASLLGRERVGRDESFFDLGGHSLLVTQAVSRIRQAFGVELPLRDLYDWPVLADLARRIESRSGAAMDAPAALAPGPGPWPLSHAQRRLWLADRLAPGDPSYNLFIPVRLVGEVSLPALEWGLSEVVRRHEILRTRYAEEGGEPVQWVDPPVPLRLAMEEAGAVGLEQLAREEAARGFDLRHGPVLRLRLIRGTDGEHALLLTLHHIAADGWSLGLLVSELSELYDSRRQGREPRLAQLALQYRDYALWQRERLTGERLRKGLEHWQSRLAGLERLRLVTGGDPEEGGDGGAGAEHRFELGSELTHELRGLCRREGVTTFMALLAGFALLLQRYSGQDDLVVGTPASHRDRLELEGLIGFFVNLLPLRLALGGNPSVRELLARVRETALEAYSHQDTPFDEIVDAMRLGREPGQASPLFSVLLSYQSAADLDLSRLPSLQPIPLARETAMFDLTLAISETATDLPAVFEYRRSRFSAPAVRGFAEHLRAILRELATAASSRTLDTIPLYGAEEGARLLAMSGGARAPGEASPGFVAAFEARAAGDPAAVALLHGDRVCSYGELDERANRIAGFLRTRGVTADSLVGLLLRSSIEYLAAMLGVLKAGGAFLPLDPGLPPSRLAQYAGDAGAVLILTLGDEASGLAAAVPVVHLERERAEIERAPALRAGVPLRADQLAYAMFTSGSTGRAKLVAVEHRSLDNYARACQPIYRLGSGDRVMQFWSCAFDGALSEIVPVLVSGGTLVLKPAAEQSAAELLTWCASQSITLLSVPTAYWHEIAFAVDRDALPPPAGLRTVVIGGERVRNNSLAVWRRLWGDRVRLVNTYGPTEATVEVATYELSAAEDYGRDRSIPIGRPLDGARLYVVDPAGLLAPAGVVGELCIGGPVLARGYLGSPALTAERFVPDRFGGEPGARLYRTGDVARWNPQGVLEFLGRGDGQVKIRGYRVELGEVEAALRSLLDVQDAVVVAREDGQGARRLVAYVVAAGGQPRDWLNTLRLHLPDYLVPATIVPLPSFPRTRNGKVDRQQLPAPDFSPHRRGRPAEAAGETERQIAAIWRRVLGVDNVGVRDNFFDVGGNSLLLLRLHDELKRALGLDLAITDLMRFPTIRALAELLADRRPKQATPSPTRSPARRRIVPPRPPVSPPPAGARRPRR
jgi:amino acid adenylation domain-containing protein